MSKVVNTYPGKQFSITLELTHDFEAYNWCLISPLPDYLALSGQTEKCGERGRIFQIFHFLTVGKKEQDNPDNPDKIFFGLFSLTDKDQPLKKKVGFSVCFETEDETVVDEDVEYTPGGAFYTDGSRMPYRPRRGLHFADECLMPLREGRYGSCHEGGYGGWTIPHLPYATEMYVFNSALRGMHGIRYIPLNVSTQIVNGTNYRFTCEAVTVTLIPLRYYVVISIHQPLPGCGEAYVRSISRLSDEWGRM